MIFGIESAVVSKRNLIANPSAINKFLKTKIKSYSAEATDFHDKDILNLGSNYTCLAVILSDFVLKKDDTIKLIS